jgi:UDP-2,3-diacylglucosamine pyrophosphatase LpxH
VEEFLMTLYPGLIEFVKQEILNGAETKNIYHRAQKEFGYGSNIKTFYKYISKVKREHLTDEDYGGVEEKESIDQAFITILEKRKTVRGETLCDELSCSPGEIFELIDYFRKQGYEIICDDKNIILSSDVASEGDPINDPLEDKEIIFGVASDLHFGSKECQLTALNEFCEICRKKGVKYIFTPGDVCAGYNVYPGQQFEVYALSAEEQEDSVIVNLPRGFEWYMLGGNHDYSFIKRGGGHNPLLAIEAQRSDVHYIGFDDADIPILPGVDMKLWHPSGGVPYSYSYRIQKGVEQIAYTELANISRDVKDKPSVRFLLAGHLHIQMQAMFGSIFGMQCGCFEGQTSYLKRKGLHPLVGGYIVKAELSKAGLIKNFDAKFYMWPQTIEDDWKNYKHSIERPVIDKPLFE